MTVPASSAPAPAPAAVPAPAPAPLRRWVELAVLFVIAPGVISLGPRWLVLPTILTGGTLALLVLLTDPTFRRRHLLEAAGARRGLLPTLTRTAAICAGILVVTFLVRGPDGLFRFPRSHPAIWLGVVILYPVVSVYLQEVLYRTFFFHRYATLFRSSGQLLVVNALLFGWAHIIVHHFIAIVLTSVGGLLFALTYHRYRSTLLVALEHALYGDFVFTIGLGGMFVNATRLLSKLLG
jgi:hypothetical protein